MVLLLQTQMESLSKAINKFTFQYGATSTENIAAEKIERKEFTFQYGATSTKVLLSVLNVPSTFTFQYGATSTSNIFNFFFILYYLHSNMVLLLPLKYLVQFLLHLYLHSNMVLLLLNRLEEIYLFDDEFTFQYGATSTPIACISVQPFSAFTFQYGATST